MEKSYEIAAYSDIADKGKMKLIANILREIKHESGGLFVIKTFYGTPFKDKRERENFTRNVRKIVYRNEYTQDEFKDLTVTQIDGWCFITKKGYTVEKVINGNPRRTN